jgi:hypothetical protein
MLLRAYRCSFLKRLFLVFYYTILSRLFVAYAQTVCNELIAEFLAAYSDNAVDPQLLALVTGGDFVRPWRDGVRLHYRRTILQNYARDAWRDILSPRLPAEVIISEDNVKKWTLAMTGLSLSEGES